MLVRIHWQILLSIRTPALTDIFPCPALYLRFILIAALETKDSKSVFG